MDYVSLQKQVFALLLNDFVDRSGDLSTTFGACWGRSLTPAPTR